MDEFRLASRMSSLRSSAIRDLLKVTEQPGMISLAGGLPAPDAFPVEELRQITERLFRERPTAMLQYSTTEGSPELRAWVAAEASRQRGRSVDPDQVLITHGSQQAIDLAAKVFIDRGDVVAIDEPGYVGAIQALSVFEPRFVQVPVDEHGLDVDALEQLLVAGERPRLLYTVVNFQNPSGATLALTRRQRLAGLAEQYGFVVVEDDPYRALRFRGDQLPSIAAWTDRVLSLSTFSKLVVPGLRVGYVVAPLSIREHLAKVKQGADLHTSSWGQAVLAELVSDESWLAAHQEQLVKVYGTRAAALAEALDRRLGDRIDFQRPDGGMFLWARFRDEHDAREVLAAAVARGVAFVPGEAFYTGSPDRRTLRLSFATASPAELDEGAARLAAALETFC